MNTLYTKILPDDLFRSKYLGRNFSELWYSTIIDSDADGYYLDESGKRQVLFRFRKNKISQKYLDIAINTFKQEAKKKHPNRGSAGGYQKGQTNFRIYTKTGQNEAKYVSSNISGYFDRPLREHRGPLGTIVACRTTAFTMNNESLWNQGLPFIQKCSDLYRRLGGKKYLFQAEEYNKIHRSVKIPNTVFTTVTTNYNWRTACHTDQGDYSGGLGNLIVAGQDFTGGYLGFPQFKVLIKILPGDFLLMDSHQFHCNTSIKLLNSEGFRLSFVMYIREDMSECKQYKKIDKTIYLIKK
jgi:hypothetical protein